jgi:hypothetical protein
VSIKTCPKGIAGLIPPSPPAFKEATVVKLAPTKLTDPVETYSSAQALVSDPRFLLLPEGIAFPPRFIFCPVKGVIVFTLTLLIVFYLFNNKY